MPQDIQAPRPFADSQVANLDRLIQQCSTHKNGSGSTSVANAFGVLHSQLSTLATGAISWQDFRDRGDQIINSHSDNSNLPALRDNFMNKADIKSFALKAIACFRDSLIERPEGRRADTLQR